MIFINLVTVNSNKRLNIMTELVHANKSIYSIYVFDSKIDFPIELLGVHNTSAAIPAFHPRPIEESNAEKKYGITDGIYNDRIIFLRGKLYILHTSIRSLSTLIIP